MEKKKIPLNSLPSPYFPSLSRDDVSTATLDKIVALKMHETTFNHPEWIDLLLFTVLPTTKTWQNQYSLHLLSLAPCPILTPSLLDKGPYMFY